MRTKSTQKTPNFSRERLKKRNVRKVGWIEVQNTNVYSRQLAIEEEFTRRKQNETESAFGERKIRFARTCFCNKLDHKWAYHYIIKLQSFVGTIWTPVMRETNPAADKSKGFHVPLLCTKPAEKPQKVANRPRFQFGVKVRIAKEVYHSKKFTSKT